jgi:hypothetical protein
MKIFFSCIFLSMCAVLSVQAFAQDEQPMKAKSIKQDASPHIQADAQNTQSTLPDAATPSIVGKDYITLGVGFGVFDVFRLGYQKRSAPDRFWELNFGTSFVTTLFQANYNFKMKDNYEDSFYWNVNGGIGGIYLPSYYFMYPSSMYLPVVGGGVGYEWLSPNTRQAVELTAGFPYISLHYVFGFN